MMMGVQTVNITIVFTMVMAAINAVPINVQGRRGHIELYINSKYNGKPRVTFLLVLSTKPETL